MFSFISCGSEGGEGESDLKPNIKSEEDNELEQGENLDENTDLSKKIAQLIETKVNKDKLISLVRATPPIWDIRIEEYTMKHIREQSWESIIAQFIANFSQLPDKEKKLLRKSLLYSIKKIIFWN